MLSLEITKPYIMVYMTIGLCKFQKDKDKGKANVSSIKIILSYIVVYTTIELRNFQMIKDKGNANVTSRKLHSRSWLCNLQMIEN